MRDEPEDTRNLRHNQRYLMERDAARPLPHADADLERLAERRSAP
jgi:hypothetical protein